MAVPHMGLSWPSTAMGLSHSPSCAVGPQGRSTAHLLQPCSRSSFTQLSSPSYFNRSE